MIARLLRRDFPHANSVLLTGPCPVLVDSGAPGGEAALLAWLGEVRPVLLVNTHWHSDHTGGNHALAARGVPIAATAAEGRPVNAGDRDACRSEWLRQAVPAYQVNRFVSPGEVLDTGAAGWEVVGLPGHTAAQVGLFEAGSRTLVAADSVHVDDVGWLDLDADPSALDAVECTLDRIEALEPLRMLSGHGPAVMDVPGALARARRRVASWREKPERIAWHACKRIFGHLLYTEGGLGRERVAPVLLDAPWFRDHAGRAFGISPDEFVPSLLTEMLRSGAASWHGNRLMPGS